LGARRRPVDGRAIETRIVGLPNFATYLDMKKQIKSRDRGGPEVPPRSPRIVELRIT
jgi:hypothetical protein